MMRVTLRENEDVGQALRRVTGQSVAVFDEYALVGSERVSLPGHVQRWMDVEEDGLHDPGALSFCIPASLRRETEERSR